MIIAKACQKMIQIKKQRNQSNMGKYKWFAFILLIFFVVYSCQESKIIALERKDCQSNSMTSDRAGSLVAYIIKKHNIDSLFSVGSSDYLLMFNVFGYNQDIKHNNCALFLVKSNSSTFVILNGLGHVLNSRNHKFHKLFNINKIENALLGHIDEFDSIVDICAQNVRETFVILKGDKIVYLYDSNGLDMDFCPIRNSLYEFVRFFKSKL